MENPQYILQQDLTRALIPEAIKVAVLSVVFYFAISLNVKLAYQYMIWDFQFTGSIKLLVIGILFVLFLIEMLLVYKKAKSPYKFYTNRIEYFKGKKQTILYYRNLINPQIKQNPIDKLFDAASIIFADKSKLKNIKNYNQVYMYIQQLIKANKGMVYR